MEPVQRRKTCAPLVGPSVAARLAASVRELVFVNLMFVPTLDCIRTSLHLNEILYDLLRMVIFILILRFVVFSAGFRWCGCGHSKRVRAAERTSGEKCSVLEKEACQGFRDPQS